MNKSPSGVLPKTNVREFDIRGDSLKSKDLKKEKHDATVSAK